MAYTRKHERAKSRISIHFKRISALLLLDISSSDPTSGEEVAQTENMTVRIVLNDITPHGVGIYTPRLLNKGQEGTLSLTAPLPFSIKARIAWAREFNVDSHVLTDQAFPYRAGLQFIFKSDEEITETAQFCDQLIKAT